MTDQLSWFAKAFDKAMKARAKTLKPAAVARQLMVPDKNNPSTLKPASDAYITQLRNGKSKPLEATVRQLRAIQRLQPRFNRQTRSWKKSVYLRGARIARTAHAGALGPFPSTRVARRARTRDIALARMRLRLDAVDEIRRVPQLTFDAPEGSIELRHGRMVLPDDTRPTPDVNVDLPPRRDELDELIVVARAYRRAVVTAGVSSV